MPYTAAGSAAYIGYADLPERTCRSVQGSTGRGPAPAGPRLRLHYTVSGKGSISNYRQPEEVPVGEDETKQPAVPAPDDATRPILPGEGIDDATLLVCVSDDDAARISSPKVPSALLSAADLEVKGGRKYDLERLVATGGMGVVYQARDVNCDRTVAIKVLLSDEEHEKENRSRFVSEARITSGLEHPNIIPIHELGKDSTGNVFYSMKFIRGMTLGDVLNDIRKGRRDVIDQYPLGRLLTIFQKTCDAVAFAHAHGVVHRDLKPGNIMIGNYGEVLVLDWGLARKVSAGPEPEPATPAAAPKIELREEDGGRIIDTIRVDTSAAGLKTISGTVLGTPGFMAPEQIRKDGVIDARTDIYALGAILYSILTLASPVREKKIPDLLRLILSGDIVPPAAYNPWGPGQPANLPHCPGRQIPAVLSDVAMRAMSVDPAERYPSVKELQQEIEDYQNGLIWHVVIDDDFSQAGSLAHWEPRGCACEIVDGALRMYGGELQMLLLKRDMPGDVRIEFECRQEGAYLNDIACILGAIRAKTDWDTSVSGYAVKYGAYTNTLNVITRCDKRIWSDQASPLVSGKRYSVRVERVGARLRWVVNNREICSIVDPDPLVGANRTVVGLLGWVADTRVSRIRVYSLGTPWKSDILDIAERHLHKGNFQTAMDLFREVMESLPEPRRLEQARRGYELAESRHHLHQNLPRWRERLQKAWPGAPAQVRIDDDGLTVEIPNAGIADLEPLRGMPLTTLVCWGNRIADLEPLRGMPLATLNCAANPLSSLEPLRGLPLTTLRCERCGIRTLEPLRGMPLATLNCAENPLEDGLEPLRGMPLTWLSCISCGVASLEPLRGMPLNAFFCENNRIADLGPLHGMPLTELDCGGNLVESLEPLRGLPLNTLHCRENRIVDLEPLRELPLSTFNCHCNRIPSLEPLRGMPLSSLICGGNALKDLGPFVKNPPKTFLFDSDTLSVQELEWIRQGWSRDFRFGEYLRDAEILLALRRGDGAKLRALAREFGGHRYLFVPTFMRWAEADELSRQFGGHLVTITSREENEFVASQFPYGCSWFWMGLKTGPNGHEWVTGEPLTFRAFIQLQDTASGPWVFYGRSWRYDTLPNARNCFLIEWDS